MAEEKYKLNTWVAVWNPSPLLFIAKNLSHPAWSRPPGKHRSEFLRGVFPVRGLWEQRERHCPLLWLQWGGGWEVTEPHFSHPCFPSELSPLHIQIQWLVLMFRPISSVEGKDKPLPLEAAGWKSCSFYTGRELKRNSRGQRQKGDIQELQRIFRISFSGQPRISPSSFCADPWWSWLAL